MWWGRGIVPTSCWRLGRMASGQEPWQQMISVSFSGRHLLVIINHYLSISFPPLCMMTVYSILLWQMLLSSSLHVLPSLPWLGQNLDCHSVFSVIYVYQLYEWSDLPKYKSYLDHNYNIFYICLFLNPWCLFCLATRFVGFPLASSIQGCDVAFAIFFFNFQV